MACSFCYPCAIAPPPSLAVFAVSFVVGIYLVVPGKTQNLIPIRLKKWEILGQRDQVGGQCERHM